MTIADEATLPAQRSRFPWLAVAVVVVLAGGYAVFALPCLMASKIATNEMATVQSLKALAAAQTQYRKKFDRYAGGAEELLTANSLIAAELARAFPERVSANGLRETPTPKAGYLFLMLSPAGGAEAVASRAHWAAVARPVEPGTTGEYEFLVTADGDVYRKAAVTDPKLLGYRQFFVKSFADIAAADGTIELSRLTAAGWIVAR